MRTLITLSLTLLLSSCGQNVYGSTAVETDEPQDVVSQKPEKPQVEQDSCPGYVQGNEYTYCTLRMRSYVVHEDGRLALEEALEEEEEEAEE